MTESLAKTLIIAAALVLITGIGGCNARMAYVRVKAFEAGYCDGTVVGSQSVVWTLCEPQVGD